MWGGGVGGEGSHWPAKIPAEIKLKPTVLAPTCSAIARDVVYADWSSTSFDVHAQRHTICVAQLVIIHLDQYISTHWDLINLSRGQT